MVVKWAVFKCEIKETWKSVRLSVEVDTLYNNNRKERSPSRDLKRLEESIREAIQRQLNFFAKQATSAGRCAQIIDE